MARETNLKQNCKSCHVVNMTENWVGRSLCEWLSIKQLLRKKYTTRRGQEMHVTSFKLKIGLVDHCVSG